MLQARNNLELEKFFMPKIKEAVDLLVQKIWNKNREIIRLVVYEVYNPNVYNRTYEFKEAWETNTEDVSNNKVEGSFFYAPDKLIPGDNNPNSPRYGQHVSAIDRFLMTEYLAEVIYQGLSGPAFGHGVETGAWHKKRDAWNKLEQEVGRETLKKWMKECFNSVGLNVQVHNTSWEKK